MFHTKLIIADRELAAGDSRTFDRIDPVTGEVATRSAAASIADAQKAADAAAAAFAEWSNLPPTERRKLLDQGRRHPRGQGRGLRRRGHRRDRQPGPLGPFQCRPGRRHDPRSRLDDHPDHRRGDPRQPARLYSDGDPPAGRRGPVHGPVERADHPWRAVCRDATRLRQYRRLQVVGELPAHPCADRRMSSARRACRRARSTSSPTRRRTRRRSSRR